MSVSNSPAGAFKQQDGHIVRGVHPLSQWQARAPEDWDEETNLRSIWREARPVDFPPAAGHAYARVHGPSGMVLIAEFGFVQTVVRLEDYGEDVRRHVSRQLSESIA